MTESSLQSMLRLNTWDQIAFTITLLVYEKIRLIVF